MDFRVVISEKIFHIKEKPNINEKREIQNIMKLCFFTLEKEFICKVNLP